VQFTLGDRVVLVETPHNREGGQVGSAGQVVGISLENDDHGENVGYAMTLDKVGRTFFVLPEGLRQE
jgi:hypothetical protein